MDASLNEFLQTLHNEKSETMIERSRYVREKIVFILGIMGFGSLNFGIAGIHSLSILYMVPLVAFGYDLYINAADEGIKRIGAFFGAQKSCSTTSEKNYEKYVRIRRGKNAPIANVLFSLIGTIGAGFMLFLSDGMIIQLWWFVLWSMAIIGMNFIHKMNMRIFDTEDVDQLLKSPEEIP
jgi:hypothetical protein